MFVPALRKGAPFLIFYKSCSSISFGFPARLRLCAAKQSSPLSGVLPFNFHPAELCKDPRQDLKGLSSIKSVGARITAPQGKHVLFQLGSPVFIPPSSVYAGARSGSGSNSTMSDLLHHLKSPWDDCRHQHPGYNYRGAQREGKCLHSCFSCCAPRSQWASLLLLRFGMLGQILPCDHAANHLPRGCQMGVGDTVSNNVSQSIITSY